MKERKMRTLYRTSTMKTHKNQQVIWFIKFHCLNYKLINDKVFMRVNPINPSQSLKNILK
jgi:hypothetical protein